MRRSNNDYDTFDTLELEEIRSLLKSNRIPWSERRLIGVYISQRIIKSYVPLMMTVAIQSILYEIINRCVKDNGRK